MPEDACQNNPLCPSHLYIACKDCPEQAECFQTFSSRSERVEWEYAIRRSELTWMLENVEQRYKGAIRLQKGSASRSDWDREKLRLEGEERVLKSVRNDVLFRINGNRSEREQQGVLL